tara:strand:- start:610 stop:1179 length:570 start_codon:yes stop_codon:yes gene_type:complete
MMDDDKSIIDLVLSGDDSKYEIIIKKYQSRIISLCYRYTKNITDAEDVAQDVFLKAYNSLAKFRFESKFYSWLHRIAVNCSLNYINSKEKIKEKETISENNGLNVVESIKTEDTPFNSYNVGKMAKNIENAYNNLPEDLKLVIKLCDIDDLSYDEIAKSINMPIGTVRSKLHRAREILLKALKTTDKYE